MNEILTLKNLLKNSIFFLLLIVITFFILFKDKNMTDISSTLSMVKVPFVILAVCCVFVFLCCEALNVKRTLKLFYRNCRFIDCLKYAFIGFFFSAITPSSSGGQPMQLYYMNKDRIEISHGSLALLVEFACYQLVTISMAVIGFAIEHHFLSSIDQSLKLMLFVGVFLNTCIFIFTLLGIFSKRISLKAIDFIFVLVNKFNIKKAEQLKRRVYIQLEKYQEGAVFIRNNKRIIFKAVFTTVIQITALHSVPFLIYKAFGLGGFSYLSVFSLQAILYVSVSALPLPGAVGASEGGFITIFSTLFPARVISSAMLLTRSINFYLFVVISGIVVMMTQLRRQ